MKGKGGESKTLKSILQGITKRVAKEVPRQFLINFIKGEILHAGSIILTNVALQVLNIYRDKGVTWGQVVNNILAQLMDPKGHAAVAISGLAETAWRQSAPSAPRPLPTQGPNPPEPTPLLTQGPNPPKAPPLLTQGPNPPKAPPLLTQGPNPPKAPPLLTQGPNPPEPTPLLTQGPNPPQQTFPGLPEPSLRNSTWIPPPVTGNIEAEAFESATRKGTNSLAIWTGRAQKVEFPSMLNSMIMIPAREHLLMLNLKQEARILSLM